jgi:hypothetical protein
MQMRASTLALAAAASALAALPAHAKAVPQLVTATYTGVVGSGAVDTLGEFGPPGASLGGAPFTATFALNERSPGFSSQTSQYLSSGQATGDAQLTIGKTAVSFTNDNLNLGIQEYVGSTYYVYGANAFFSSPISSSADTTFQLIGSFSLPAIPPGPPDYHSFPLSGWTWDPPPGQLFSGAFIVSSPYFNEALQLLASGLTVTSIKAPKPASGPHGISFQAAGAHALAAVPEPASWTTLLLGVGALGAIARRRRALADCIGAS